MGPSVYAQKQGPYDNVPTVAILTTNIKRGMIILARKLLAFELLPIMTLIYLFQGALVLGACICVIFWWGGKLDPCIFHWTINCVSGSQSNLHVSLRKAWFQNI